MTTRVLIVNLGPDKISFNDSSEQGYRILNPGQYSAEYIWPDHDITISEEKVEVPN